ncbi:ABC transporter substrate-binding protein [Leifsonia sp. AG29]|uniref:ABC transporter substrate-binding protein n=1 Tax=Leifsonia sp. AG29 TaxID=2598860 RepID=UPI00131B73FB|nr:ABC transporter substrate-binding protein [Leifsonia sp. AG29]
MTHSTKTSRRVKRSLLAATALSIALVLAACSGTSGAAQSTAAQTPVKYQLSWLKITQFGGFFAADKEKFFSDEGIEPTFTAGGSNILAWQQVANGTALLGDEDNTLLLEAIAKGEPLVAIGAVFQKSPMAIMSLADKPISSAKDLEGKTIAYPDNGIAQLKSALQADGVDVSKVTIVPAGADPTQLVTHQVAGYGGYATSQGASLEVQGLKVKYLYVDDITKVPSYGNVIVTTKANLADPAKRKTIEKFMTAAVKGYEWMNAHPEDAAKIVVNDVNPTGGLKLSTETQTAKIQASLIESKTGVLRVSAEQMQAFIDSLVAAGTLTKKLDAKDVVDPTVLDAVYGDKTSLLE